MGRKGRRREVQVQLIIPLGIARTCGSMDELKQKMRQMFGKGALQLDIFLPAPVRRLPSSRPLTQAQLAAENAEVNYRRNSTMPNNPNTNDACGVEGSQETLSDFVRRIRTEKHLSCADISRQSPVTENESAVVISTALKTIRN